MSVMMHSVVGPSQESSATKIGVLLLESRYTSLRCFCALDGVDGHVETQSRIEFGRGHPFEWTHLFVIEDGRLREIGRPDESERSVPLQAGWLVAKHLAERKDKTQIACSVLMDETDELLPAVFKRVGDTVTLFINDQPKVYYRLKGEEIFAIEWDGMVATSVDDDSNLMAGLSAETKRSAGEFLADAERRD